MFRPSNPLRCIALLAVISSPVFAGDDVKIIYPAEDRAVAAALESPASETYYGTLREILQEIAKEKRIRILIDEVSLVGQPAALEDVIDYDVQDIGPRRAQLEGLDLEHGPTLAAVLDEMFARHAITYVVEDGVLKVMTEADAGRKKLMRGYDVSSMTDSTMSVETLAATVSNVASGLEPTGVPSGVAEGGTGAGWFDRPGPVQVSAYKQTLVCLGSKSAQERVVRAIVFLRELDSE